MVMNEPSTTISTRMMRKAQRNTLTAVSKAVSVRLGLRLGLRVVCMGGGSGMCVEDGHGRAGRYDARLDPIG
jgi:hypothetical protein